MLETSIAKILSRERQTALGCGVAVAPRGHIVTCAHVVADALGVPRTSRKMPAGRVDLVFPFCGEVSSGSVVAWSPVDDGDVAVMACDMPDQVRPIPLFQLPLTRSHRFRAFGFPRGYASGRWGYGELLDAVPGGMIQAASSDLAPGFSGGPVEDLQMGRLIGLLTSYDAQLGAGFVISAGQIARVWPQAHLFRLEGRFSPVTDGLMGLPGDPLTGLEQFLQEYLGTEDTPRAFGGRKDEFDQLDKWLTAPQEPTAAIVAPAGRGKSALVTRWIARVAAEKRADVAFVPISIRFNTAQKLRFTMLLGARLTYLAEGGARKLASSDPDQWIGEIGQRLRESRPEAETPLLVVLDGLDEATDWRAGADLSIPPTLGDGIKVLVSARILAHDRGPEEWIERLGWPESTRTIELPPLSSAGVADVLRSMGDPLKGVAADVNMVGELTRLSEGDPLLVSLYVEALRGTEKHKAFLRPEELTALDRGLDGYFDPWWRDQRRQWGTRSPLKESGVQAVLNVLACALGPLGEADVLDLAAEAVSSWSLGEALETLARFVIGDGREQGYSFTHPRLSQYFYSRLSRPERDMWNARFAAYGRSVVERLRKGALAPEQAPPYVLQNHTAHLARAVSAPADYYALLEEPWVRAWERHDGSFTGYLRDVLRAWNVAECENDVYWQIFCAFCHSSIVSLHAAPPPVLIARALKERMFNEAQVLGLLQQLDNEGSQAGVIQAIAPLLGTRGCQTAAALARKFSQADARAAALSSLVAWLPEPDVVQLVHAAGELEKGAVLLDAAAGAAITAGNARLIEEILQTSDEVQDEQSRAELLCKLVPHLSDGSRRRVLSKSESFATPSARALILVSLSSYLPEDLLPAALQAAAGIWYPYRRAETLVALLEHVPPSWRERVTDRAREGCEEVTEDDRRAELLIRLSPHVAEPERSGIIRRALDIIEQNVGGARRTELLSLFPANLPDAIAAAYAGALQRWTDPLQRVRLLLRLSRDGDGRTRRGILKTALRSAQQIQNAEIALALDLIGREAPPDLIPELLAAAEAVEDKAARAEAIVVVACLLEPRRQEELVAAYIGCMCPEKGWQKDYEPLWRVVARVAPRLCGAACDAVRAAVSRAERWRVSDESLVQRFEALVLLARHSANFDELLEEASQLRSRTIRARALDLLTPLLDRDRLGKAIAVAWRIGQGDPEWYGPLSEIPAEQMPRCSAEQATAIVKAADELYAYGPRDLRAWAVALSIAGTEDPRAGIERISCYSPDVRIAALARCISCLPAEAACGLIEASLIEMEAAADPEVSRPDLDRIAAGCPERCLPQTFELCERQGLPAGLLLRLAVRMPAKERRDALETALSRIDKIDSAEQRTAEIGSAAESFGSLSPEEFERILDRAGNADLRLANIPKYLEHAAEKVQRQFAASTLRLVTGWEMDAALHYFELLVPMLPAAEVRQLVEAGLDTANPIPLLWERLQAWPAEVQARVLELAGPLLTPDEADFVARRSVASEHFSGLLPGLHGVFSALDAKTREQLLAVTLEKVGVTHLPQVLRLLEPAARSELFRSVVDKETWFDQKEVTAMAQMLAPSDIALLLEHSKRGTRYLKQTLWAAVPYLDRSSVPRALELAAEPPADDELQFLLMTRLGPAGFVGSFLRSSVFPSWRVWNGEGRLDLAREVSGSFESAAEFGRTLRMLGSLKRPQFTAILRTVLRPAIALGGAETVRGVLEAVIRTSIWWP
jgi:hypothetical protein